MAEKNVDAGGLPIEKDNDGQSTPVIVNQESKQQLLKCDTRFVSSEVSPKTTNVDGDLVVGNNLEVDGNIKLAGNVVDDEGKNKYAYDFKVHPIVMEDSVSSDPWYLSFSILSSHGTFTTFEEVRTYCKTVGITIINASGGGYFGGELIESVTAIEFDHDENKFVIRGYDKVSDELSTLTPQRFVDGDTETGTTILGVLNVGQENPTLTRYKDSVGKTYSFVAGTTGYYVQSDFDSVYPYSAISIVEDDDENKFVRIPKFYSKKKWNSNGTYTLTISNVKLPGYDTLFVYEDTNGVEHELPYIDVGCYEASATGTKLQSVSGVAPLVSQTMATFRTYAQANGTGYQIEDFLVREIINELFMIEFATTNSQSIFVGITDGSNTDKANTGLTDGITTQLKVSGKLSLTSALISDGSFKYRGMENIYGNIWEFVDGISFSGTTIFTSIRPSDYESGKTTGSYTYVGERANSSGYAKKMSPMSNNNLLCYTSEVGGGSNTYYCDYYYWADSGTILLVGGRWSDGAGAGLFDLAGGAGSTYAYSNIGSRLVRKPIE